MMLFLDTTKVLVSITYGYGNILAVSDEQSFGTWTAELLPDARCLLQPFLLILTSVYRILRDGFDFFFVVHCCIEKFDLTRISRRLSGKYTESTPPSHWSW